MRRVATRIFLAFAVSLMAFAAVAVFSVLRLQELRRDLRLLSAGYLPLTRIAAELEVKDWLASRALEARDMDRAAREAYLPVARAHFPALVREKVEEGKRVLAAAAPYVRGDDDRFAALSARLDALGARWAVYDGEARGLFDAILAGEGSDRARATAFEARVARVRQLEKGLSLDVKRLQADLESQVADRIRATERTEANTVVLIVLYSLIALAVGAGAALISQRLLAPIQRLTEGVKAVAAGNLSRKVEVRRDDEIGLLAREFNTMAASLDRQQTALRRAERLAAVGRISAQITHEIRNPLNAIGLNTELLAEEIAALPEPRREALQMVAAISREVDRLNAVTEHYLRFARLPRPVLECLDLNELLTGLLDFLAPELAAASLSVGRDLAGRLLPDSWRRGPPSRGVPEPPSQRPRGHTGWWEHHRPDPPVRGLRRAPDPRYRRGDPPGDLTRIFEPFYSTKERGTGLGLAFTQQVVEEHGGTIRCDSALGRGTLFTLRFPTAPGEVNAVAREAVTDAS